MSDEHKSDHYTNRRNGVHYNILQALPKRIRVSWIGRKYWTRVVMGDYSHFHCDPSDSCVFCEDHTNLSRLDRLRYSIEQTFDVQLGE